MHIRAKRKRPRVQWGPHVPEISRETFWRKIASELQAAYHLLQHDDIQSTTEIKKKRRGKRWLLDQHLAYLSLGLLRSVDVRESKWFFRSFQNARSKARRLLFQTCFPETVNHEAKRNRRDETLPLWLWYPTYNVSRVTLIIPSHKRYHTAWSIQGKREVRKITTAGMHTQKPGKINTQKSGILLITHSSPRKGYRPLEEPSDSHSLRLSHVPTLYCRERFQLQFKKRILSQVEIIYKY